MLVPFVYNFCFENGLTESPRPSYLRSFDVRDLPTSEEDATHKDYTHVVQTVNSMVCGVSGKQVCSNDTVEKQGKLKKKKKKAKTREVNWPGSSEQACLIKPLSFTFTYM